MKLVLIIFIIYGVSAIEEICKMEEIVSNVGMYHTDYGGVIGWFKFSLKDKTLSWMLLLQQCNTQVDEIILLDQNYEEILYLYDYSETVGDYNTGKVNINEHLLDSIIRAPSKYSISVRTKDKPWIFWDDLKDYSIIPVL
jgi:hypothetical protein